MDRCRLSGADNDDVAWRIHFTGDPAPQSADGQLHVHADAVAAQRSPVRISRKRHGDMGPVGSHRYQATRDSVVDASARSRGNSDAYAVEHPSPTMRSIDNSTTVSLESRH